MMRHSLSHFCIWQGTTVRWPINVAGKSAVTLMAKTVVVAQLKRPQSGFPALRAKMILFSVYLQLAPIFRESISRAEFSDVHARVLVCVCVNESMQLLMTGREWASDFGSNKKDNSRSSVSRTALPLILLCTYIILEIFPCCS